MAQKLKQKMRLVTAGMTAALLAFAGMTGAAQAQSAGESYIPTIWIDPDGCEHFVMDDGAEGYMTTHMDREGNPVCHRAEICGVIQADQLFATDKSYISAAGRSSIANFFRTANATGFLIYGHTDSRASDEYNIGLSNRRASAVASVASETGARVVDIRGFGERRPVATNDTAEGMQRNRRVEIYCLR